MTDPLRELLTTGGRPTEVRPVPNARGGWDVALIIDGGYGKPDADEMAGWWAARLMDQGVPTVAPERTTTT